jgi:hypothetical protein
MRIRIQGAKPMLIGHSKTYRTYIGTKALLEGWNCKFWPIQLLLDPDPHSHYESASRRAKSMRIWILQKDDARCQYRYPALRIRIRDPGSGAFLTPGSGIRNRFFPDPGSRIPDLGSRIPDPLFLRAY